MKTIAIIGATGFIGRRLTAFLAEEGAHVIALTRNSAIGGQILPRGTEIREWNGISVENLSRAIEGVPVIVNLAGENIAGGTWTRARKRKLIHSRVETGRLLSEAILGMEDKPDLLLQGSAIGFYGPRVPHPAGERHPAGTGFLAELTQEWESSIGVTEEAGVKVIHLRTGIVLGRSGGMLAKILPSVRYFAGAIPGNGAQWLSWIHIDDMAGAIAHLISSPAAAGPFNMTAPNPVTMREMMKTLGKLTGRPVWFKIPAPVIRAVMGEMGRETLLASQNIIPEKLLDTGYAFRFSRIEEALKNILKTPHEQA